VKSMAGDFEIRAPDGALRAYHWPGNCASRNLVERALAGATRPVAQRVTVRRSLQAARASRLPFKEAKERLVESSPRSTWWRCSQVQRNISRWRERPHARNYVHRLVTSTAEGHE